MFPKQALLPCVRVPQGLENSARTFVPIILRVPTCWYYTAVRTAILFGKKNKLEDQRFWAVSSLLVMRSTSPYTCFSSRLTLLPSPDSAGGGLGRARVVLRRGVRRSRCFSQKMYLYVPSVYSYISGTSYVCRLCILCTTEYYTM